MGDTEQEHAKQREYDSYADLVDNSKLLMSEKESCRQLLATAYGNTNGDPPEVKQKKMCEFDWQLSKHIVHLRVLVGEVLRAVGDRGKETAPKSRWERILDRLQPWRNQIAAIVIAGFFAPHTVEVLKEIIGAFR